MKLYLAFSIISLITYVVDAKNSIPFSWLGSVCNIFLFIFTYILLLIPIMYQYYDNLSLKKLVTPGNTVKVWRDNEKK
jgi:energy-coupling factor transporter transmembrane protein EcfT